MQCYTFVVVFDFHQEADKIEDLERGEKKYVILLSYFDRSSSCVVQHTSLFLHKLTFTHC